MNIECKTYELKKEFFELIHITSNQWDKRKDAIQAWLHEFYDYKIFKNGRVLYITINEIYGEYRPLPRKLNTKERSAIMIDDYDNYTIQALGTEYKYNSKSKVARDAIEDFGGEKYGHTSTEYITKKFIRPAFNKYGETNNQKAWVWYSSYQPLSEEEVENWRHILKIHHMSESEAASAWYK